jgi:hypothetical protein
MLPALVLVCGVSAARAETRVIPIDTDLDDLVKVRHVARPGKTPIQSLKSTAHSGGIGGNAAAPSAIPGIRSVPNWAGSVVHDGKVYPYFMVGTHPATGIPSRVDVNLIPVRIVMGNGETFDGARNVESSLASPVFGNFDYRTGNGQFVDAVQRATFWNAMPADKHVWHLRMRPKVHDKTVLRVPDDFGAILQLRSGQRLAVVDFNYILYSLEVMMADRADFGAFDLVLLHNVVLANNIADLGTCCTIGFHTFTNEFRDGQLENVKTWGFASWLDEGIFRNTNIADIASLSHELSEWANDPFVGNAVPPWSISGRPPCSPLLEVADPLVGVSTPVTSPDNRFTYHPQTVALLQWFARASPSDAIDDAYSFPGETALIRPAECSQ